MKSHNDVLIINTGIGVLMFNWQLLLLLMMMMIWWIIIHYSLVFYIYMRVLWIMTTKRALRKLPRFSHSIHKSSGRSRPPSLSYFSVFLTTKPQQKANSLSAISNFLTESIQNEVEHEFMIESNDRGQCVCIFGFLHILRIVSGPFHTHK